MRARRGLCLAIVIFFATFFGCTAAVVQQEPIPPVLTLAPEEPQRIDRLTMFLPPLEEEELPEPFVERKTGPHKIMVVGDSLSVGIGVALARSLKGHDGITVFPRGKVGSGLNSPRFYNWEAKLRNFVESEQPDIIVVLIGGNDAYNGPGTDAWAQNFKNKVESFIQIAADGAAEIYWVGLPVMNKQSYSQKVQVANNVMESVCSGYGNCHFVDTWDLSPEYSKMRAGDGIHFTFTGYMFLGKHILNRMSQDVDLDLGI